MHLHDYFVSDPVHIKYKCIALACITCLQTQFFTNGGIIVKTNISGFHMTSKQVLRILIKRYIHSYFLTFMSVYLNFKILYFVEYKKSVTLQRLHVYANLSLSVLCCINLTH